MFVRSRKVLKSVIAIPNRNLTVSPLLHNDHYTTLGITPKATQSDIKAAYYKLSMLYHPDKNKDSEEATVKFRSITAAYEVLGNYKLRKLYDKGIIHTAGPNVAAAEAAADVDLEDDDPQTKFYKQHMKRKEAPHKTGRTPIYDFDEWARSHYASSFERNQAARLKFKKGAEVREMASNNTKTEIFLFGLVTFVALFFYVFVEETGLDRDKTSAKKSR